MKSISKILMAITLLLSFWACNAQNSNQKTETKKVYGNCEMCKSNIEKAGNAKKIAKVDWNKNTKMATITYDSKKTTQDEILKRIALAGYDSDEFLAPDDAYAKLDGCCQYERKNKIVAKMEMNTSEMAKITLQVVDNQLKTVFDSYFALKDALVKSDGEMAYQKAGELVKALAVVKMEKLTTQEHTVWMAKMKDLVFHAQHIAETKEISHQRDHFMDLSKNMYELMKVSKQETPTYFQHCPMYHDGKGADWLSKENSIRNPYYGSQMLNCGKTVETIK
jgi:copper chaperone CopZ